MSLDGPHADVEVPVEDQSLWGHPYGEAALGIGHEEGEELPRVPIEGPQPRVGMKIFHGSLHVAAQLDVVIMPKSR